MKPDEGSTGVEKPRELITKIKINQSNLKHIAETGVINGSLLIDIETIINDVLSVERHLVKVKQKEKECLEEKYQQAIAALKELIPYAEEFLKNKIRRDQPYFKEEHSLIESAIDDAKTLSQWTTSSEP